MVADFAARPVLLQGRGFIGFLGKDISTETTGNAPGRVVAVDRLRRLVRMPCGVDGVQSNF